MLDAKSSVDEIRVAQGAYNALELSQRAIRDMQTTLLSLRDNSDE